MGDNTDLERRIADLEAKCELLRYVVFALTEAVKPERIQYFILALAYGFTAEQQDALNEFWKWAVNQDQERLTKEEFVHEFENRMPQPLKGKLEEILRAYQADGFLSFYCKLVLGDEEQ